LNGATRFRLGGAKRDFFFGRDLFSRSFPDVLAMSEHPTYNEGKEARQARRRTEALNTRPIRKLTEEEAIMVQENMDLIIRLSQKERAEKRSDYHQDLALTLCAAAQTFRPDEGTTFRTYVSTCLKNKTSDYKKRKFAQEYAEAFEFCDEIEPLLKSTEDEKTRIEHEVAWAALESEIIKHVASDSPRVQKGALTLLLSAKGYTRAQIAARLSVTPDQVTRWSKAAKNKLAQSHALKALFMESVGA
jgi:RNA polymerase sigma factor (sigma-70 family)